ncbi:inositol polyphosphate kinase-domain-containing protein [Kalaharituber pfeilii]|nr:inositol polyphosphate kinase-domain-containing protein [Kalaharituber pfeilii]
MSETPKPAPASSTPIPALTSLNLKSFNLAAAGHDGVLSDESGSLVIKPCTAAEVSFYEVSCSEHPEFAAHMPTFFGTLQLSEPSSDTPVPTHNRNTKIVLSNVAYGFTRPCVLDVKLGAQLWDENASAEKRARLDKVSNESTSRNLGMRIAGMKVYKGSASKDPAVDEMGYRVYDKYYGRVFTAENVIEGIKEYLISELTEEQVVLVAKRFLERVRAVRKLLESQESRMYSASLLFCYEGDRAAFEEALKQEERKAAEDKENDKEEAEEEEEEDEDDKIKKVEDMKLIDFAHATWTPGKGPDENALQGVRSMEKLLAQIAKE